MGKPEETVKTVLATFDEDGMKCEGPFVKSGSGSARLEETLRSTREKQGNRTLSVQNRLT